MSQSTGKASMAQRTASRAQQKREERLRNKSRLTSVKCGLAECLNFLNKDQLNHKKTFCSHACANCFTGREKRGVTIHKYYDVRIQEKHSRCSARTLNDLCRAK